MLQNSLDKLWDTGAADVIEATQKAKQDDIHFYIDQEEERKATMTVKHKALEQATRKKQMRLECEHTQETDIVAPSLVSVSQAERSSNEENSDISEGS